MAAVKNFLIWSIVVCIVAAVLTSYFTISYFMKPVLLSGQQGQIQVSGLESAIYNVIVVDPSVKVGISDTVTFSNVVRGQSYETDLSQYTTDKPYPFLIRNEGTDPADVKAYVTNNLFSDSPFTGVYSDVGYWVEQAMPEGGGSGAWATIDACSEQCFESTPCSYGSNCKLPLGSSNAVRIVKALKKDDPNDEFLLHIKFSVPQSEPSGTKSTTLVVIGGAVTQP